MLTVSIQKMNDVTILKCRGRIVRGDEKNLLCSAMRSTDRVMIEMSEVEAIDAAGIGMLVSLQAAGVYLTLLNPSRHVRTVLRLTELDSILPTAESAQYGAEAPAVEGGALGEVVSAAMPLAS